jgi:hypothetical protein
MRTRHFTILILGAILFFSCGGGKTKTHALKDIEFTFEGPLYEGSNPAQYVVSVDLKSIFGSEFKEGMSVDRAILKKAEIFSEDTSGFSGISALVLSLASDNAELQMQELAVINHINPDAKSAELVPSSEAEASDFFNEKQFYLVLDATLAKDIESNLKLKGNFEFELGY